MSPTALTRFLRRASNGLRSRLAPVPQIPAELWLQTTAQYPFLAALSMAEQSKLRAISALFLQQKEFTGAHGMEVTDAMAVAIAAQACLPLLHWGDAARALSWYDDFVGIVVHPAEAVATRRSTDAAGVTHQYSQVLLGEAMERGPVMLAWPAVASAGQDPEDATSVVIHEFIHKIDMKDGAVNGRPPLRLGFAGTVTAAEGRKLWGDTWTRAYEDFREKVVIAQRFGGERPWLNGYGATAPEEFFAVVCEAYFVEPVRFAQEFPTLAPLLDAFFKPVGDPLH
ncbi:M90 family metallopeptidase [Diaphorobacter aerolatus]|uniref:Zinc-dependent peptidase n=1 Tax=Diaphorobacter aerolatus TaxID=1288495 RepID=A0A7H0GLS6_9BURK|nr:M90 family metallopeptidase [Diaphorobacter aerolatus]QNP49242.1 zinc-dependent peptidase [Diaphorobacter aerolatus]